MPAGPVILNNTPLVALMVLGRLDLLRDLFGEVLIPDSVKDEFLAVDTALRREALANAPWIRVVPLVDPRRALPYFGLDLGEAEVLALAEERSSRSTRRRGSAGRQERASRHRSPPVILLALKSRFDQLP